MVVGWSNFTSPRSHAVPKLLSLSNLARDNKDLQAVCDSVVGSAFCHAAPLSSRSSDFIRHPLRFGNALETLLDRASSLCTGQLDSASREIFGDILSGTGIAEVTGASGSGKTSFCIHYINSLGNETLYIDTSGSFSIDRVKNPQCLTFLRVFNCEELEAVIVDFKRLLSDDEFLPVSRRVRARAVRNVIIDSLWPVMLLEHRQKRHDYLTRLCSTLRQIAWRHNIMVIVCSNSSKLDSRQVPGDKTANPYLHDNWRSRCYLQILLEQRVLYSELSPIFRPVTVGSKGQWSGSRSARDWELGSASRVRRVMTIRSGSNCSDRYHEFEIESHNLLIHDT